LRGPPALVAGAPTLGPSPAEGQGCPPLSLGYTVRPRRGASPHQRDARRCRPSHLVNREGAI
jgi:hypothetical protein